MVMRLMVSMLARKRANAMSDYGQNPSSGGQKDPES